MPYFMILRLGPAITLCCVFEVRPPPRDLVGRTHVARRSRCPWRLHPFHSSSRTTTLTSDVGVAGSVSVGRAGTRVCCRAAVHGPPCGSVWLRNLG